MKVNDKLFDKAIHHPHHFTFRKIERLEEHMDKIMQDMNEIYADVKAIKIDIGLWRQEIINTIETGG